MGCRTNVVWPEIAELSYCRVVTIRSQIPQGHLLSTRMNTGPASGNWHRWMLQILPNYIIPAAVISRWDDVRRYTGQVLIEVHVPVSELLLVQAGMSQQARSLVSSQSSASPLTNM